jgi:hypothetical protein
VAWRQKGGRFAFGQGGAELLDLLAEGIEAQAERFGRVLLATAIDEDRAEGFVEALGVVGGLQEEKATRVVVHASVSGCEEFLSRQPQKR